MKVFHKCEELKLPMLKNRSDFSAGSLRILLVYS